MALDREAIYKALFARLSGVSGLRTSSRILRNWEDLDQTRDMPALYMTSGPQRTTYDGPISTTSMTAWVYLYVSATGRPGVSPDEAILQLVQKTEAALEYQPGDVATGMFQMPSGGGPVPTTLGGLVQYARIGGEGVRTDEGAFAVTGVAVATMPIEMLAAL